MNSHVKARLVKILATASVASAVLIPVGWRAASAVPADCLGRPATVEGATDGPDHLVGTAGDDVIVGGDGSDTIEGGAGKDTICGGIGADRVYGQDGDDTISGESGADVLSGGHGLDLLVGGRGTDNILGGAGTQDFAIFAEAATSVSVNLATGQVAGDGGDRLSTVESVIGSRHNDTLTGSGVDNFLIGLAGDDTLNGAGGFDLAIFLEPAPSSGVDASLERGDATGEGWDTLLQLEGLVGSPYDDTLTGGRGSDLLFGSAGTDHLYGRNQTDLLLGTDGDDWIYGQGGDDFLSSGAGTDQLFGGTGTSDVADYLLSSTPIDASLVTQEGVGEKGVDAYRGIEGLRGSSLQDTLEGDAKANILFGMAGNDDLVGRGGNDYLDGGEHFDSLDGGRADDACINGESVSNCETTPSQEPPTSAGDRILGMVDDRIAPSASRRDRQSPREAVAVQRGTALIDFPTQCLRDANGRSGRVHMPIGVPGLDWTSGIDAQRIWYRGVLYNAGDRAFTEWFYTDVHEQGVLESTASWTRYMTGEVAKWYWTFPINGPGVWSMRAELWWWQDGFGWIESVSHYPVHRDFDGVARGAYCSPQLSLAQPQNMYSVFNPLAAALSYPR